MSEAFLQEAVERLQNEVRSHAERLERLEAASSAPVVAEVVAAPPAPGVSNAALEAQRAEVLRLEEQAGAARRLLAEAQTKTADAERQGAEAERRAREERAAFDARLAEERTSLDAQAERVRQQLATLTQVRRVQEKIWPRFLLAEGPFAAWKDRLERAHLAEATPAAAALLFAGLHAYTACLLENDQKYLRDTLRDVSRFLLAWVKEGGADERAACEVARQWAAAFNAECAGRAELEVPEPGMPINTQWMNFVPRGNASPDVTQVITWCVRDGQRRVVHRAEVFP